MEDKITDIHYNTPMTAKIAIIEDDLSIQQMYKYRLELAGYNVKTANDGQKGLDLLASFLPDLIMLDIRMPNMSGDEMLQKLRAEDWGGALKVFILTNISKTEAPASLRMLQVDRYIVKAHHTPRQIVEMIQETLGS